VYETVEFKGIPSEKDYPKCDALAAAMLCELKTES
jgi:hypothetical protein